VADNPANGALSTGTNDGVKNRCCATAASWPSS
jgi:hypothetical protein